jgi:V8-like Glu-specific endopeptidase
MAHRLGSLVSVSPAREFRPGSGSNLGGGAWEDTFTAATPPVGNTKFLILHFAGVTLNAGDRLEVPLGNGDTDVFTPASGPDFWTRPVKGGSVTIRFVDGGSGAGRAPLTEYGRGEGIVRGGADGTADISTTGGNANGDVFMLDTPYVDPPYFTPGGGCPVAQRDWTNVASLPPGVMRDVARSTGIFIEVGQGKVSSCSAALIGPDLILTAGHCRTELTTIPSGSFTLDYETDAAGNRIPGYNPKFYKLKRGIKTGYASASTGGDLQPTGGGLDYAIIQIATPLGGVGVSPLPIRADLPAVGDEVFLIHHPRGATKKVSKKPADPNCSVQILANNKIYFGGDVDNGSSGSPLFDMMGRIIGVAITAGGCPAGTGVNATGISATAAAAILIDMASGPPPATDVDVVLVFDKSGSMTLPGLGGGTKIEQAREAAALFVDLLQTDRTHRAGLVTFSTTASVAQALAPIATNRDALIGPPPGKTGGLIAAITPNGMTTIGGGLQAGRQQLVSSVGPNTPAIVLLTDGLQNTPPMIADVEPQLGTTRLCVIGFGTEGQLNGPLLTSLARDHGGIYTRASEGLALKKFFVLCFGNIFQTGIASDPFFVFPAGASSTAPMPLGICDEEQITVVLSWKNASQTLILSVITPSGSTLTQATPGVLSSSGATWVYFRLALPFNGEREGTWQVQVTRAAGGGELFEPPPAEPFFVTVTAVGGPVMRPLAQRRRYYTGDAINPQVVLRYPDGYEAPDAKVTVEIESPANGTGNVLTGAGLGAATVVGGDQLDARSSTLIQLEQAQGGTLIGTATNIYPLFDDGVRDGDDALEPDGVFGNPLADVLRYEGSYTFHARARYGHECTGTRETLWSTYVSVGIDPGKSKVEIVATADAGGGKRQVTIRVTPQDRYGNPLGPGRGDQFGVSGTIGTTPNGPVHDRGDGSYDVGVLWDPAVAPQPGVVIAQPERPPVAIMPPSVPPVAKPCGPIWLCVLLVVLLLIAVLVILLR